MDENVHLYSVKIKNNVICRMHDERTVLACHINAHLKTHQKCR